MPPLSEYPYLSTDNIRALARVWREKVPEYALQLPRAEYQAVIAPRPAMYTGERASYLLPQALSQSILAQAFRRSQSKVASRFSLDTRLSMAFVGLLRTGLRSPLTAAAQWVQVVDLTQDTVEVALHPQYRPAVLSAAAPEVLQGVPDGGLCLVEDHTPEAAQDAWLELWIKPPADPFTALDRAARLLRLRYAPL